ncbi:amidase [Blastococcus saxobsidens]|uniref:6-aminohexanoate-cyclic-dimer hydrolase n=1 Tax=Blastococcus saxobsidens (strain DD2) TaxID=1146883 RepID=H6RLD2_BLASD|nr:amidase [Blastococcus saxobsidens]CCG02458.1 6-aminohexanoate-cyclic-dimer hydrolase [Blastococcus saxobsidens DD2]
MIETTWLDATAQAELIRDGEATPAELVEAAIERIQRVNPQLDAVIRERFDAAREEARGELPDGPFRGVPLLLKDLGCHVAGEETNYGTSFLRDAAFRWPGDSYLAQRFRAAGFVVLGRTNVPEFGTTITTEPAANAPARNPYDTNRSTGGSSGGSAAAVAAGLVPVAHAGDGGGSIRIPASECGLVGLKPTRARVSQGPDVGESWAGATTDGVVTRSVRDTAAVLDVLAGPMPGDPYVAPPLPRPLAEEVGAPVGRLRVGLLDADPGEQYLDDPACRAAVERAGRLLADLGCDVEPGTPDAMFDPLFPRFFTTTISADIALTLSALERALGRPVGDADLERRNVMYRAVGRKLSAEKYVGARTWLGAWTRRMSGWWAPPELGGQGFDLLVTPTIAARPPELGWFTAAGPEEEGRRINSVMPFTAQFNVTGQPAISLPLHWTDEGLPVGVQIVAAFGREDVLVRVAAALEEAAPWADRRPAVSA